MKYKYLVLTLAGIALLQQAVLADSLTFSQSLVFNSVPCQGSSSGNNYHVSGQYTYGMGWTLGSQFDNSLGHLDSMDWSVTLHSCLSSQFNYWQPPGPVGNGLANESWTAQLIRIGSFGLEGKYLLANTGLPVWGNNLVVPVGGSINGNLQLDGTITSHMTDPGLLNDFVQGTAFYVDTVSKYDFNTLYANGGAGLPDLQVQLSYTYNFTPAAVPEPSSLALLMLGGVAVAVWRRRK